MAVILCPNFRITSDEEIIFGPGIIVMALYWITGISKLIEFHGYVVYPRETYLWSETKNKWLKGPDLPFGLGVEKGCLTLLNRTSVMIIGLTNLIFMEGII